MENLQVFCVKQQKNLQKKNRMSQETKTNAKKIAGKKSKITTKVHKYAGALPWSHVGG